MKRINNTGVYLVAMLLSGLIHTQAIATETTRFNDAPKWIRDSASAIFVGFRSGEYIPLFGSNNIWAWMREGYQPILFKHKEGKTYFAEIRNDGDEIVTWIDRKNNQEEKQEIRELRQEVYKFVTKNEKYSIQFNESKMDVDQLLIFSAIDCGACVKLEKSLNPKTSYVISPSYLNNKSLFAYNNVYCSDKRGESWKRMMLTRKFEKSDTSKCRAPSSEITVYHSIVGAFYPIGVKKDGNTVDYTSIEKEINGKFGEK